MNWFHPIACDKTVKEPLICDNDNLIEGGFSENSFMAGKLIEKWNSGIFFQSKKKAHDGLPDDVLQNHLMIPVFSERLIQELNRAKIEGIQFLPIEILDSNGKRLEGYSIANFLNFIDAMDYDASLYNRFSETFPNPHARGKIAGIRKFVLKRNLLHGLDALRLKEYKFAIFVSETFKSIFEKNRFTGYSFKKIQLS